MPSRPCGCDDIAAIVRPSSAICDSRPGEDASISRLVARESLGRAGRELRGERLRLRDQLGIVDNLVDEPPGKGVLGAQNAVQQQELHRPPPADDAWQQERDAAIGGETDTRVGQREPAAARAERQICSAHQSHTGARRRAVYRGDDRRAHAREGADRRMEVRGQLVEITRHGGALLTHRAQIAAKAEVLARAREHYGADFLIGFATQRSRQQLARYLERQRVVRIGTAECKRRYAIVDVEQHRFVHSDYLDSGITDRSRCEVAAHRAVALIRRERS